MKHFPTLLVSCAAVFAATSSNLAAAQGAPGSIQRAIYTEIPGSAVGDLTADDSYPESPTTLVDLSSFEGGPLEGELGTAIRGFLIPTVSGEYRFWISASEAGELWLSEDEDPANLELIAEVEGSEEPYAWEGDGSTAVTLEAGVSYYIEALQKQSEDGGHLTVAWAGPDFEQQLIPGANLAPDEQNFTPRIEGQEIPVRRGTFEGAFLGTVNVIDANPDDTHTDYTITGGTGVDFFEIDPETGGIFLTDMSAVEEGDATSYTLEIEVTDSGDLTGTGTVTLLVIPNPSLIHEIWTGIQGEGLDALINDPRFPQAPTLRRGLVGGFNTGDNFGNNYGSRIRGFLTPTVTGAYQFYLAADDEARLYLSTSSDPDDAVLIASVDTPMERNQWTLGTAQPTASFTLTEGVSYYIEVLHRETTGSDFVQVGWTGPGVSAEQPFTHYRFQPTAVRDGGTEVQLGELRFYRNGVAVKMDEVTAAGASEAGFEASNLVDGTVRAKWVDPDLSPVIFTFPEPIRLNGYQFATADDRNGLDPVSWTLEGSNDEENWTLLHAVNDHPTTEVRFQHDEVFLYVSVIPPTVLDVFTTNQPPVFSEESYSYTMFDTIATGTVVDQFAATDPEGDSVTFAILSGDPDGAFAIDGRSGELTVADSAALIPGTYTLEVAVQDTGSGIFPFASSSVEVEVEVVAALELVTPTSAEVNIPAGVGLILDVINNLIPGGPVEWSMEEGPGDGTATFEELSDTQTGVRFSEAGSYLLHYETTTEGEEVVVRTLRVNVDLDEPEGNVGPEVNAGSDITGSDDEVATLEGEVTDEDGPEPDPVILWTVVSGPGAVSFDDPQAAETTAAFSTGGDYVLHLTADDGVVRTYDDVNATISTTDPAQLWRQANFGEQVNNPAISGDAADPDQDGLSNLLEYAFATDPNAFSAAPEMSNEDGVLTITYRRNLAATDLNYAVQVSNDLVNWAPAVGTEEILTDDGEMQVIRFSVPHAGASEKFLRVEASRPEDL